MSILNVWVTPESGLVATDSLLNSLTGDEAAWPQTSKIFVLPHFPAILAARGLANSIAIVAAQINLLGLNFDDALKRIPDLIAAIDSQIISQVPQVLQTPAARLEVIVVGQSPARGRIIGREFVQAKIGDRVRIDDIDPEFSAPWREGFCGPRGDSVNSIVALTRAQHRELSGPLGGSGGEIVVGVVTRENVTVQKMGALSRPHSAILAGGPLGTGEVLLLIWANRYCGNRHPGVEGK